MQAAIQCIRWFLIQPRLGADRSSAISGSSVLRSARNNDIRPIIHQGGEDSRMGHDDEDIRGLDEDDSGDAEHG